MIVAAVLLFVVGRRFTVVHNDPAIIMIMISIDGNGTADMGQAMDVPCSGGHGQPNGGQSEADETAEKA